MNEDLENIIKKVQKLYRLADRAGTEEEAHAAMLMARELIAKYELNMADIENFEESDCGQEVIVIKKSHIPSHCRLLLNAMRILFQCRTIVHRHHDRQRNRQAFVFIGVGADALLAKQTFEFLTEFAKRKIREKQVSNKNDYLFGFALAVFNRVFEMQEQKRKQEQCQEYALIPLKNAAIDQYVDKHYQNLTTSMPPLKKRDFSYDLAAGMNDGNAASLNRQVGHKRQYQIGN